MHLCVGVQRPCGSAAPVGLRAEHSRMRSYSVGGNPNDMESVYQRNQSNHKLTFEFNLEDHIQKTRKAAGFLKQLFHTQSCHGICMATTCIRVATLLKHVQGCENMECIHPGCNTTKSLLKHARECKAKNIMNPIKDGPFCLMCTIAGTSENGVPKSPCYEDSCDSRSFDNDDRCRPLVCDEMIEFSRVPFQSMKSITPRAKTFSDSDFVVQVEQPSKKARSKSMDALSMDDDV